MAKGMAISQARIDNSNDSEIISPINDLVLAPFTLFMIISSVRLMKLAEPQLPFR